MNAQQSTWSAVSRSPEEGKSREHSLVLQSMGIRHISARDAEQHLLLVPTEAAPFALEQIEKYERENRGWPPREEQPLPISRGVNAAILYGGLLVLMFLCDRQNTLGLDWFSDGRASAQLIRHGQWWRAITALTLHLDVLHLAGNVVFGALLSVILAQSVGVGVTWMGFVLTGAIGNYANAWIQAPTHSSIGASTAVFGVLGIQVAFEWWRRRKLGYKRWRRWAPLIMGVVWLGWFGTGGGDHNPFNTMHEQMRDIDNALKETDVMAHVLGFGAGILIGSLLGIGKRGVRWSPKAQIAWALSAPLVVALAWLIALNAR